MTKKKILIVDDDRTTNALLQTLLELDGFVAIVAHHVDEALKAAETEKPDAIIMDVHIAGASGVDLLRTIRAHADLKLKAVPVVMCSGMNVEYECKAAGANAFVLKPYQPDHLTAVVKKVLA